MLPKVFVCMGVIVCSMWSCSQYICTEATLDGLCCAASRGIESRSGGGDLDIPEYGEEPPSTSEAVYTFGHNLLTEYRKLNPNSNVVFSPASITAALSLVYFGSNGQTKKLMESVLGFQVRKKDA